MKRAIFLSLALSLTLAVVSWSASAKKKLKVVASIPCLASITESVGGDHVEVSSITRGVQDAHFVEAKPSYMVTLSRADLLIYSGMELEIGWLPLLIQGARNNQVSVGARGNLNASSAISEDDVVEKPRGEMDRTMGDVHPMGNPHYLINPHNSIKVATMISERLKELDPEHKQDYQKNLEAFKADIESRIVKWEEAAAGLNGMEVVAYHPHWSYLLYWLGIKPVGYVELRPGIPPTPKHKKAIIDLTREREIKVVVISSWKEPTKAREVAQAGGATLVILPGEVGAMEGTDDYAAWIDYLVREMVKTAPAAKAETP